MRPCCFVVDGAALEVVLSDDELRLALLQITRQCKAVIACRVSPNQKKEMVELVKDNTESVKTLAIGDGANDVPMIQGAHIGVGISGQEGLQAANASDYSVGQFKFLKRLLLVHGRYNYRRMAKLVTYMLYKNILLALCPFWYTLVQGFSGQVGFVWFLSHLGVFLGASSCPCSPPLFFEAYFAA